MSTTNTSSESNMEALLSAILTRNESFLVVPQSRVEELLLAIYESGGAGGGGESGVDSYARSELLKKVDKVSGYSLLSDTEITRLSTVTNYNDAEVRGLINNKVSKATGYTLISETELTRLSTVKNYDDTEVRNLISGKLDNTVTIAGLEVKSNPTATQLSTALSLTNYVLKETGKGLSTNDFTSDNVNTLSTVAKFVTDNSEAVGSISKKYEKPSGGIPKTDLSTGVQESLGKADTAIQSHQSLDNYVKTNDSRLTDSRKASDVYDWAKAENKPTYTKSDVGLNNVDNKSSETIRSEITSKNVTDALGYTPINLLQKGAANGLAELDANGQVPSSQLPSYVDDVIEVTSLANAPTKGDTGKIYVTLDDNKTYRWSGSTYVEISKSLAIGTGSGDAFRGDYGNTAYTHSQTTSGNPHNVTKTDIGLENVGNFKSVSTVANQGLSDQEKAAARANIGAGTSSFDGKYSSLSGIPSTFTPAAHSHAGSEIAINATSYSKDAEQKTISKDTKVDKAVAQLEYRTDILAENKVDKTTVSSSISSSKCTIEALEKAKAVSVCTMKGKTQKVVQMVSAAKEYDANNLKITNNSDKTISVVANTSGGVGYISLYGTNTDWIQSTPNHKYYIRTIGAEMSSNIWIYNDNGGVAMTTGNSYLGTAADTKYFYIRVAKGVTLNLKFRLQIFDVTAMGLDSMTLEQLDDMFGRIGIVDFTTGVLWNAANESVVSQSVNMCPNVYEWGTYYDTSSGKVTNASYASSKAVGVVSGKTYTASVYNSSGTRYNGVITTFAKASDTVALRQVVGDSITIASDENFIRVRNAGAQTSLVSDKSMRIKVFEGTATTSPYSDYFKHTAEIPISLTSLADYGCSAGDVCNYIDFENGLYYHNVGSVDLGSLTWVYNDKASDINYFTAVVPTSVTVTNTDSEVRCICNKYASDSAINVVRKISDTVSLISNSRIYFGSKTISDINALKTSMSGVTVYYQISPEVKDISDIIRPLKVESGGTVTFVNPHNIDCDTVVKYKKEV